MDLLEYLSDKLGCQYISQLHYISITPDEAEIIQNLPTAPYARKDYQEVVRYIDMDDSNCQSIQQAKNIIIQKLLCHSLGKK